MVYIDSTVDICQLKWCCGDEVVLNTSANLPSSRSCSTLDVGGATHAVQGQTPNGNSNDGRINMGRIHHTRGCLATAASTVRLVALMKTVIGSVGDPSPMGGFPPVSTNRCSDFDLSGFTDAMNCGTPLSSPCFDFSRCRDGPTVYVYDREVKPWIFCFGPASTITFTGRVVTITNPCMLRASCIFKKLACKMKYIMILVRPTSSGPGSLSSTNGSAMC